MRELCILRSVSYPGYRRFFLAKGTQGTQGNCHPEYLFHLSSWLEKNWNYIVHLVNSSHILFARGHFLLLLVNDFVRR